VSSGDPGRPPPAPLSLAKIERPSGRSLRAEGAKWVVEYCEHVNRGPLGIWIRPLALAGAVFVALSVGFHFDAVGALTVASLTALSVRQADRWAHRTL
jgi:hypothetical protein